MSVRSGPFTRRRWWVFAVAATVALGGLAAVSSIVLAHERFQLGQQSLRTRELQLETAKRSMEAAIFPAFAAESTRPPRDWKPVFEDLEMLSGDGSPLASGVAVMPSPILGRPDSMFRFYFEWSPTSGFRSPHLPRESLHAALIDQGWTTRAWLDEARVYLDELRGSGLEPLMEAALEQSRAGPPPRPLRPAVVRRGQEQMPELVLLRVAEEPVRVQGVLVAWPLLRDRILNSQDGLVRDARLIVSDGRGRPDAAIDRLSLIPVELELDAELPVPPRWIATRTLLAAAWIGTLLGLVALAVALASTLRESARRGRFASLVSHELRSPLTTFRLMSELLASGAVRDEQTRAEYFATLVREADRLQRVVDNVLLHTRVEQRRSRPDSRALPLDELIGAVWPRLERRALEAGATLEASDPRKLPAGVWMRTEPDTLEQILGNLVDNAIKYGHDEADPQGPCVRLDARVEGRRVRFRIEDDGPGIPSGSESRLFQPFSRLDGTSDRPGIGLGLPLARGLARDAGGDLAFVRDAHRRGATFELTLPLERNGQAPALPPQSASTD